MVTVAIRASCTFCGKELKANSVDGIKVLEEKCGCHMSKEYFNPKVVDKPHVYKKPKEVEA